MGQYIDSIVQFLQFSLKVLPELKKHYLHILSQSTCPAQVRINAAVSIETGQSAANAPETPLLCSSFIALHPCVDMKSTLSFIISLYKLSDTLAAYRADERITDEPEVRRLYGCLSGAADPSRSTGCALANWPKASGQRREPIHAPCLSDRCRLQLAVLPSFSVAAPKLKKYMQFYVDLHSYMYYPEETRTDYLQTWSDYYLKRYQGISMMEFCAASDSLIGVIIMYASAADPGLTDRELTLLDEACFPWLCGLESLLRAYVRTRSYENSGRLNYCSSYRNLRECEQRLSWFAAKAEEACLKLKHNSFFISLIRMMLGLYLSDPEANFGMSGLASRNILKKGPRCSGLYCNGCKLLRFCRMPI